MNTEPEPSAILILANGRRVVLYSQAARACVDYVIATIGPKYFAAYILQPSQRTINESRKTL